MLCLNVPRYGLSEDQMEAEREQAEMIAADIQVCAHPTPRALFVSLDGFIFHFHFRFHFISPPALIVRGHSIGTP